MYLTESTWDLTWRRLALLSVVTLRMAFGTTSMNTWQDLGSGVGVCEINGWLVAILSLILVFFFGREKKSSVDRQKY